MSSAPWCEIFIVSIIYFQTIKNYYNIKTIWIILNSFLENLMLCHPNTTFQVWEKMPEKYGTTFQNCSNEKIKGRFKNIVH